MHIHTALQHNKQTYTLTHTHTHTHKSTCTHNTHKSTCTHAHMQTKRQHSLAHLNPDCFKKSTKCTLCSRIGGRVWHPHPPSQ